ncbi:hypothetical protein GQ457_17G027420 [Hibiscus cannabinus]
MCPHNTRNSRSAPPPPPTAVEAARPPPHAAQFMPNTQQVPAATKQNEWFTGLCSCSEDFSSCFPTCCCPCITFGQNAEIIDRGTTSTTSHELNSSISYPSFRYVYDHR